MKNFKIYCVTDKVNDFLDSLNYEIGWVGHDIPPVNYISCNNRDNIFYKEKYYSELTFHYWYWKNMFNDQTNLEWIGFCQKRRFWANQKIDKNSKINLFDTTNFLSQIPKSWEKYDAIICESIELSGVKRMKIFKRGNRSLIKDPSILWNKKKHTIKLHFDMHHGYGNLIKAANLLEKEDRNDFIEYINTSTNFHPNIMFVAKPKIVNLWFNALFPWLLRCEKIFGFDKLHGYDTQRLYAYLGERYLSFWFKKNSNYLTWPLIFRDISC